MKRRHGYNVRRYIVVIGIRKNKILLKILYYWEINTTNFTFYIKKNVGSDIEESF